MKKLTRNLLGSAYLEKSSDSDNLGIALARYFEKHIDRPENDQIDDETGWSEWAIKKVDEALDFIVEEVNKELNDAR